MLRPVTRLRAIARTAVCLFKVFPMLPSRPLNWVTSRPTVERLRYSTSHGDAEGDLYRPSTACPHPGVVVCLGVVPFGVDHPQVPRLGEALARSGFAALLYWSPAMRDFRLDPADIGDIASAYQALLARPYVDRQHSGLLGTCVGGAFALMASAHPRIRDRVNFVSAYAPYASIRTLARDIASASRTRNGMREPWEVDPLTRKVYEQLVTTLLEAPAPLLEQLQPGHAETLLQQLPLPVQEQLCAMSPITYVNAIRAPLIVLLHDRDDPVIPVSESHCLRQALSSHRGLRYTEFTVFKHLDPTKSNPKPLALARELVRFARAIYPLFEQGLGNPEMDA